MREAQIEALRKIQKIYDNGKLVEESQRSKRAQSLVLWKISNEKRKKLNDVLPEEIMNIRYKEKNFMDFS